MQRSSALNFESLQGFKPCVPKAAIIALVLVAALEITMRALPVSFLFNYSSRLGLASYMQRELLPKADQPRIAVFGTSRGADAIMPRRMDKDLGLPEWSTVNLCMIASHSSDWTALYQACRAKLSKTRLVICIVDEWTFSSGYINDEHYCLTAPFDERWNYARGSVVPPAEGQPPSERQKTEAKYREHLRTRRNILLLDGIFQMRLKLAQLPAALTRALGWGRVRPPRFDENYMVRSNRGDVVGDVEDLGRYRDRINLSYANFDTHPAYVHQIELLARMVQEDGNRFVLMNLPNRHRYQDEVDAREGAAYAQHRRVTTELAEKLGVKLYFEKYPEEIGLNDHDYEDYGHMVTSGAQGCTDWLAGKIREDHLLEK